MSRKLVQHQEGEEMSAKEKEAFKGRKTEVRGAK
jgi:hypothetical protein